STTSNRPSRSSSTRGCGARCGSSSWLRLERAGALCPELRAAFRGGVLSWAQSHALVPILALEHSQPWRAAGVAHAAGVSVRRLEEDVEHALVTGALDPGPLAEAVHTGADAAVSGDTIQPYITPL